MWPEKITKKSFYLEQSTTPAKAKSALPKVAGNKAKKDITIEKNTRNKVMGSNMCLSLQASTHIPIHAFIHMKIER